MIHEIVAGHVESEPFLGRNTDHCNRDPWPARIIIGQDLSRSSIGTFQPSAQKLMKAFSVQMTEFYLGLPLQPLVSWPKGGLTSLHLFHVTRPPGLVQEGLGRAVEAQDDKVALTRNCPQPVLFLARGAPLDRDKGRTNHPRSLPGRPGSPTSRLRLWDTALLYKADAGAR